MVITAPRKRHQPSLHDYHHLPEWIESSEFVQQYRKDYPNEPIQLSENLVFELPPGGFNDINEVCQILESCRFFGINDWHIFSRIITHYIRYPVIKEIETAFEEYRSLWQCIRHFINYGIQMNGNEYKDEETQLKILRYAHENGCAWNKETCSSEAIGGYLNCLIYAHENGCLWDAMTCSNAAGAGHLECLKYAHENGCPWNEGTCRDAADEGQLECLSYAHENGCPWN
eukprot:CAMPEP_0114355576 /NCGR_PEP_ID=MMETSP0101-20121206/20323_1 /TAXON_ID=38822 ORGANISM="Pteridomonas danica, Strain PT" /NCGR_SAMPLE_ID=MMETSP0101 /ASSEMBLY_ACC=CAM_ASM_000211 /LENGTH=228 /DNA_ID=CAMNT_0001497593 /DNA_START=192 /DNA_END=875 /DNA_ORIENTATION=+